MVRYGFGDQCKPFEEPNGRQWRGEQAQERLKKKNAGENQDEEFYAGGNEAAPVEVVAPSAERTRHSVSERRQSASVKVRFLYSSRRARFPVDCRVSAANRAFCGRKTKARPRVSRKAECLRDSC